MLRQQARVRHLYCLCLLPRILCTVALPVDHLWHVYHEVVYLCSGVV
jgi:hypothetical protein